MRLSLSVIIMLPQIWSQTPKAKVYWWLGKTSPFGGRNYNFEEIQRGEHISNNSRFSQRGQRRLGKRQAELEEDIFSDDDSDSEINLNEIDTECPRLSSCVPRFFCERFRGRTEFDQIPCLLTSGEFSGEFGICCQDTFPRACPRVPRPPPPAQCRPRPLGRPEDDECRSQGEQDSCLGLDSLCCFNGCINVCLPDPPYSVQNAYFIRKKAFMVSNKPDSSQPDDENGATEEFADNENYEDGDDDYTDFINPRKLLPLKSRLSEDESDQRRLSRILERLFDALRDRIS